LSQFLNDLERGPLALRLDSLEVNAHDPGGQQLTMSAEINALALIPSAKK